MVLHLGDDVFVRSASVVAILDFGSQPDLAGLLASPAPDGHRVRRIGRGEVKSVIAAESGGQITLYFSPISSRTLYLRAQSRTA